ncbi:hypothetical protein HIM_12585 [Hirsutella minnesotensis 3608]|uniref:Uncharacterized protein n=1 Tax=Hirsutella minnesotensis 3608 TaxID=1043627 RepID=A0A0F7ZEV0_9HYPO|nr:hypothetical protein HIM_12585 [Hirsutella minnesotensis 3608]
MLSTPIIHPSSRTTPTASVEEIEGLRKQLREEQRLREAAEGRVKEKRQREEEQRQSCPQSGNRPFFDDTRGHDESDRPNLSSTNHPVDHIPKGTRKSLESAFIQSLIFFPSRVSILTPAGLCEIPSSPGQQRGVRNSERNVVENTAQKLVDATYDDSVLRNHLGLDGTVTFESHLSLGVTDDSLSKSMEQVSTSSKPPDRTTRRRKARGKGNRADQLCIYRTSDDRNIPAVAIEYKAPA